MDRVFIARQPIFRRDWSLYGYELLFRSDWSNRAEFEDGDSATSEVIMNTFTVFGLNDLVGENPAFINLTRRFLTGDLPLPLPSEQTVVEVLEDTTLDRELIDSIKQLRSQGFSIALDDFRHRPGTEKILPWVDIVKIEMGDLRKPDAANMIAGLRKYDVRILAEKLESREDFEHCRELGCDLFQGYFLSPPKVESDRNLSSNRQAVLDLLVRVNDPDADLEDLEKLIQRDISLSYKLLRYINSAYYRRSYPIESIRQAVVMLGLRELRRWASIVSLCSLSDTPDELIKLLLIRAKLCELIARDLAPDYPDAAFMAGLFSDLDEVLGKPMAEVVGQLPISDVIRQALVDHTGPVGMALQRATEYERADQRALKDPALSPDQIRQHYLNAVNWQQEMIAAL